MKEFTFDEHVENGKILQRIYNDELELLIAVSNTYGKTSKEAKEACKAHTALGALKSLLDDRVCAESPDRSDRDVISVYYCNNSINQCGSGCLENDATIKQSSIPPWDLWDFAVNDGDLSTLSDDELQYLSRDAMRQNNLPVLINVNEAIVIRVSERLFKHVGAKNGDQYRRSQAIGGCFLAEYDNYTNEDGVEDENNNSRCDFRLISALDKKRIEGDLIGSQLLFGSDNGVEVRYSVHDDELLKEHDQYYTSTDVIEVRVAHSESVEIRVENDIAAKALLTSIYKFGKEIAARPDVLNFIGMLNLGNSERVAPQPDLIDQPLPEIERVSTAYNKIKRDSTFRQRVLEAYGAVCVICGYSNYVEAAHLVPKHQANDDRTENGAPLCPNHHWELDNGLITVDEVVDQRDCASIAA